MLRTVRRESENRETCSSYAGDTLQMEREIRTSEGGREVSERERGRERE